MRTTAAPAVRSRSVLVFWALVALIVTVALGSQLLRAGATSLLARPTVGDALAPSTESELKAARLEAGLVESPLGAPAMELPAAEPLPMELRDAPTAGQAREAEADATVDDALIVRTGSLELEVEDVATSLDRARREIAALGGYVAGSDEYDQGESRWASVTYRMPVERFSEAIEALRGLADRVVRESTQSAEVTATVVDLDARIANLRASEAALVEIMDRAGRIDDVLAVQLRLEDVRGRIEQLVAQRDDLADQAALSTLTVSWLTPVAAVAVAQEGWDAGRELDAALARTVEAVQGLASLAIWFAVVVLPLAGLPLLVVLGLVVSLRRRGRAAPAAPSAD